MPTKPLVLTLQVDPDRHDQIKRSLNAYLDGFNSFAHRSPDFHPPIKSVKWSDDPPKEAEYGDIHNLPSGKYIANCPARKHVIIELLVDSNGTRWWRYDGQAAVFNLKRHNPGTIVAEILPQ